jgi:thiosulfate/3-mercaptopyruvate sulfurtransferase
MGHFQVALLDGGFPAWKESGYPTSDKVENLSKGDFVAIANNDFIITTEYILNNSASLTIVDARSPERFCGKIEPIDPIAGHVPNAINRPLTNNLENGRFKSPTTLKQEWEKFLSGTNSKQVVHMCGSGVTACHNQLAMEIAEIGGSRIYAGSWSEWIRDPSRSIETC